MEREIKWMGSQAESPLKKEDLKNMDDYKNQTFLNTPILRKQEEKCRFGSADEFYEMAGSG
ncbi:hypothetical protein [Chitinophaga sp. GbtcB8]|uniref:hypothetical protein n=1 Tax=Chitinophaga sp. GbtcB8 TaxID=2824753 RepID=UPI001C310453|nr:hypothetical protein [Chitinophaga sp. GbtcB8]